MVTRSSTVVVVASCLAIGLGVGFSLGRGGRVVTAQVGGIERGGENPSRRDPTNPRSGRVGKDESDIYDQLAREYEQFRHVDRMFELVSKAVTPSVVHIVTVKTQRARKF